VEELPFTWHRSERPRAGVAFMSHWLTAAAAGWLLDSASLKLLLLVRIQSADSHPTGRTSSRLPSPIGGCKLDPSASTMK
jgi:hypothetical protein